MILKHHMSLFGKDIIERMSIDKTGDYACKLEKEVKSKSFCIDESSKTS